MKSGARIDPVKELRKDPTTYPLIVALDDYMREKRATLKEQPVVTYEKWSK